MTLAYICLVGLLFALVLLFEVEDEAGERLRPAGLLQWLTSGNWTAKLGALLLSIGSGALLRYLMLHLNFAPAGKILAGVLIAAVIAIAAAVLAPQPRRRAISLALTGAASAVAYLTAYSAYEFFHFVADLQALSLLFALSVIATGVAVTRRALSIAVLAMIGAYLAPAFSLRAPTALSVYGYYAAASLVTLLMVWLRGWRPLIHLSFLFTLAGALFFGWTQKLYTPDHYGQMQPLLLLLVALHLAMPLLERDRPAQQIGAWERHFDQAYFLALPLVAAVLTLVLAPRLRHEGALGLLGLSVLWTAAAAIERRRSSSGSVRYLAVALILLCTAGLLAVTQVPVFLFAAVASCLVIGAARRLELTPGAEFLAIGAALATSACYALQSLLAGVTGTTFLLGVALLLAWWVLHRRGHALGPIFRICGGAWLLLSVVREIIRLQYAHVAELAYLAALAATAICILLIRLRPAASRWAVAFCGITLLLSGFAAAPRFAGGYLLALMIAGQLLYSLLALTGDRHGNENDTDSALARSALPLLLLPWAVELAGRWSGGQDTILTLLVASALCASLQGRWLNRHTGIWPDLLSPLGFGLFGATLLFQSLFRIERNAWSVAFELIGLIYVLETAQFLWAIRHRYATAIGYLAIGAVASVSAALLLRLIGPPGTLTILDLNRMVLPAFISLLWAAIGGLLTWVSTRKRSRILWSLGALLMVAAAVKLILFDFGSLGQIGNILAMMGAGAVFLIVAWLAPFPPRASGESAAPAAPAAGPGRESSTRWQAGVAIALLVLGMAFALARWNSLARMPDNPGAVPAQTVDAASPPHVPAVDVGAATYSSARNGQYLEVTAALKVQCRENDGSCAVHCGDELAGDPDPGQTKICTVIYGCGLGPARTARFQEGRDFQLSCR